MSDIVLDHKNALFLLLANKKDYRGAHASLAEFARKASMTPQALAGWQAHLLQMEGNVDEAASVLRPHIEVDDIPGKFLRHQRARLFLWNDRPDEARTDLEALLTDNHPRIAALHSGCRVQLAYLLAMQGDPGFVSVFDAIPEGRDYVIKGEIVGKDELIRLYEANRAPQ